MRLFRYECNEEEPRLVSEPHTDVGLLSLVVGDVPGLETWDLELNESVQVLLRPFITLDVHLVSWYPIEVAQEQSPTVSVLAGQVSYFPALSYRFDQVFEATQPLHKPSISAWRTQSRRSTDYPSSISLFHRLHSSRALACHH